VEAAAWLETCWESDWEVAGVKSDLVLAVFYVRRVFLTLSLSKTYRSVQKPLVPDNVTGVRLGPEPRVLGM
jgi:hypothetical protein